MILVFGGNVLLHNPYIASILGSWTSCLTQPSVRHLPQVVLHRSCPVPVFVAMLVDKPWKYLWENHGIHGNNHGIYRKIIYKSMYMEDFPNITADVCWFTNHCFCVYLHTTTPQLIQLKKNSAA